MAIQDVSIDMLARGAILHPGERIYRMDTGHHFRVFGISDELASRHGAEVKRLFATEVDQDGRDVQRLDGKTAEDEDGHAITIQAHDVLRKPVPGRARINGEHELPEERVSTVGEQISHRDYIMAETEAYLQRCALMSENHVELAKLDDLFVASSKAHRIPRSLVHLRAKHESDKKH
jgi:hypothetical protein